MQSRYACAGFSSREIGIMRPWPYGGPLQPCIGFWEIIKKCQKQCPKNVRQFRGVGKSVQHILLCFKTMSNMKQNVSWLTLFWKIAKCAGHFFRHPGIAGHSSGHCVVHFLMISQNPKQGWVAHHNPDLSQGNRPLQMKMCMPVTTSAVERGELKKWMALVESGKFALIVEDVWPHASLTPSLFLPPSYIQPKIDAKTKLISRPVGTMVACACGGRRAIWYQKWWQKWPQGQYCAGRV